MIYWRNLGQSWSEMFRGSFTAGGFVTAGAAWLGLSKTAALAAGVASTLFWPALSVLCGFLVWKWRIIHAQLARERDNTPAVTEQLALLRSIASDLSTVRTTWCPVREYATNGNPHPLEQGEYA